MVAAQASFGVVELGDLTTRVARQVADPAAARAAIQSLSVVADEGQVLDFLRHCLSDGQVLSWVEFMGRFRNAVVEATLARRERIGR